MNHNILYTGAVALAAGAAILTAAFMADAAGNTAPAPPPEAVVTTPAPDHLAPRCFETSTAGAEDCAWVPVAACLTDEAGDEAIPPSYEGCYWDAPNRGNHAGASYVIWRGGRG